MSAAEVTSDITATPLRELSAARDLFYVDVAGDLVLNLAVVLTAHTDEARAHLDAMAEVAERNLGRATVSRKKNGGLVVRVETKPHWEDA